MMVWDKLIQVFQVANWPVSPILLGNQEDTGREAVLHSGKIAPFNSICLTSILRDSISSLENEGMLAGISDMARSAILCDSPGLLLESIDCCIFFSQFSLNKPSISANVFSFAISFEIQTCISYTKLL